ncbi:glycosyltransferase family A protein [Chachezhania sediminis]|uniref:glycosyltransferase family A protein n=1 Tax=Chachezhania sediminis TaxID=2599291 RepID=UPI00131E1D07|nr:glycosyltransferase family A protein [Chachezhania sediminis]
MASLTVAIPTHDDAEPLARLLARLARLAVAPQVVVVDDGSAEPLEATALTAAAGLPPGTLQLIRHDTALGPGAARNAALAAATGDWLLYLDADDLPTADLPGLLADLDGCAFDFCLFQHHDSRRARELAWGQMRFDQRFWDAAGVALGALTALTPDQGALLAQTANYPWNKIYRTAFLRDHAIHCTPILVHEDVELHWQSFLNARQILVSDRVCAIHYVAETGDRLTNRRGPERLEAFGPLARIAAELAQRPGSPYGPAFWTFTAGLILWIDTMLEPKLRPDLSRATAAFLSTYLPAERRAALEAAEPALWAGIRRLIARHVSGGHAPLN